ncbi:hypothetical protein [Streptomyces sp. NPDC054863]
MAQLKGLVEGFAEPGGAPPRTFSSGLHAATLCADAPFPWGDATAPAEGRAAALDRAVRRLDPRDAWPFAARTAATPPKRACTTARSPGRVRRRVSS